MPIIHECLQGTPDWLRLRMAIPTASEFDRIVTPKTLKLSSQAEAYADRLLASYILGYPLEEEGTPWMQRGQELEDQAYEAAENILELETEPIGFITNEEKTIGCSPDRVISDGRLLEIKCPSPQVHVAYMRRKAVSDAYRCQLQGQLWVAEREEVVIFSFHPTMPAVHIRVRRDEVFIAALKMAVESFSEVLEAAKIELEQRYGPFARPLIQQTTYTDDFGVTMADVDLIWSSIQKEKGATP